MAQQLTQTTPSTKEHWFEGFLYLVNELESKKVQNLVSEISQFLYAPTSSQWQQNPLSSQQAYEDWKIRNAKNSLLINTVDNVIKKYPALMDIKLTNQEDIILYTIVMQQAEPIQNLRTELIVLRSQHSQKNPNPAQLIIDMTGLKQGNSWDEQMIRLIRELAPIVYSQGDRGFFNAVQAVLTALRKNTNKDQTIKEIRDNPIIPLETNEKVQEHLLKSDCILLDAAKKPSSDAIKSMETAIIRLHALPSSSNTTTQNTLTTSTNHAPAPQPQQQVTPTPQQQKPFLAQPQQAQPQQQAASTPIHPLNLIVDVGRGLKNMNQLAIHKKIAPAFSTALVSKLQEKGALNGEPHWKNPKFENNQHIVRVNDVEFNVLTNNPICFKVDNNELEAKFTINALGQKSVKITSLTAQNTLTNANQVSAQPQQQQVTPTPQPLPQPQQQRPSFTPPQQHVLPQQQLLFWQQQQLAQGHQILQVQKQQNQQNIIDSQQALLQQQQQLLFQQQQQLLAQQQQQLLLQQQQVLSLSSSLQQMQLRPPAPQQQPAILLQQRATFLLSSTTTQQQPQQPATQQQQPQTWHTTPNNGPR